MREPNQRSVTVLTIRRERETIWCRGSNQGSAKTTSRPAGLCPSRKHLYSAGALTPLSPVGDLPRKGGDWLWHDLPAMQASELAAECGTLFCGKAAPRIVFPGPRYACPRMTGERLHFWSRATKTELMTRQGARKTTGSAILPKPHKCCHILNWLAFADEGVFDF